jgi:hypothetical protein
MSATPHRATAPTGLPILGHGKHRDPSLGACFMEYTALLAGERFTDAPKCVDRELAAVMRGANDLLSDDERPVLVPLLGRAIGLVIPGQEGRTGRRRFHLRRRPVDDGTGELVARLRHSVSERFVKRVGPAPSTPAWRWYQERTRLSRLFWDLLSEPDRAASPTAYAQRLVARLELLHECYEEVLAELGLPGIPEGAVRPSLPAQGTFSG